MPETIEFFRLCLGVRGVKRFESGAETLDLKAQIVGLELPSRSARHILELDDVLVPVVEGDAHRARWRFADELAEPLTGNRLGGS